MRGIPTIVTLGIICVILAGMLWLVSTANRGGLEHVWVSGELKDGVPYTFVISYLYAPGVSVDNAQACIGKVTIRGMKQHTFDDVGEFAVHGGFDAEIEENIEDQCHGIAFYAIQVEYKPGVIE